MGEGGARLQYHLCTQVLLCLEPGTLFHGAAILTCLAWLPCFPSWGGGVTWRGYAAPCTSLQSNHYVYEFSRGGVAMSGGDEMDTSSRVLVDRRLWLHLVLSGIK
jgi:hypothetical protein